MIHILLTSIECLNVFGSKQLIRRNNHGLWINIHKAINEVLPTVNILGCLFHFAKAIKRKIEKSGLKSLYDKDNQFRNFIQKVVGLSSLPLADLVEGFNYLKSILFEDEKLTEARNIVLFYIEHYWMYGCYPPFVWNTWSRADDYSNNNQVI